MIESEEEALVETWKGRGQGHLFAAWDKRPVQMKQTLLGDLKNLDIEVYELLQRQLEIQLEAGGSRSIEPISPIPETE